MVVIIDFDGTCVTHAFPEVGVDIGAEEVLKNIVNNNHLLLLSTMRCNHTFVPSSDQPDIIAKAGNYLDDALDWFNKRGIPLWGIQTNPTQSGWTTSPKPYGHLIIDDIALGCPLKIDLTISNKPFVDWEKVKQLLIEKNII
jgi:hypothetical protein